MNTLQRNHQLTEVHIRWLIRRDLLSVLAVDADCFVDRWSENDFIHILRKRNAIGMSVEVGDQIAGFVIYELNRRDIEIVRLAIAPAYRRCGLGSMVVAKLRSKLSDMRRREIVSIVSDDNLPAHLFLRANRFRARVMHNSNDYIFTYRLVSQEES